MAHLGRADASRSFIIIVVGDMIWCDGGLRMEESNLTACVPKSLGYVAEHRLVLFAQDTDTAIVSHRDLH